MKKRALLIIDVQNDFCEGGSLAVKDGDDVVPVCNKLRDSIKWDLIVLSQDFHPKNHLSFASNNEGAQVMSLRDVHGIQQVMWPDHCVQETKGAEFHPKLKMEKTDVVIQKGMNWKLDSYSAFFENDHKTKTELDDILKKNGISDIYLTGLALDYCVKYSAVDGKKLGYETFVVVDGCKGLAPKTIESAKKEMSEIGIKELISKDIK